MSHQPGSKRSPRVQFASALLAIVAALSVAFGGMARAESAPAIDPPAEDIETLEGEAEATPPVEDEAPVDEEPLIEEEAPTEEPVALQSFGPQTLDVGIQAAVAPIFEPGNPSCASLGFDFEVKIEPVPTGNSSHGITVFGQAGTIEILNNADGIFDFTSTIAVDAVIAKGGPDANLYVYTDDPPAPYSPGPGATFGDTGLHTPENQPGRFFGVSHISFCFQDPGPPELTIEKVTDVETDERFDFEGDLGSFDLGDGEGQTFPDLEPGEYRVDELVPDGWTLENIVCEGTEDWSTEGDGVVVNLVAGDSVTCTFTNNIIRGDLTIVKETDVETDQRFDFDGGDLGSFDLGDGDSEVFAGLLPGTYTVIEDVPDHWTLEDIDCGDAEVTFVDDGVSVHLESGDSVTCTFTNHFVRANLIIEKETDVETDERFDFDPDFADPFDLGDGENEAFADLLPGDYTVIEDVPDDWTLEDIDCGDAEVTFVDDGVTVHLESGDSVTCTFFNEIVKGDLTIVKETDVETEQAFTFTPNFDEEPPFELGSGQDKTFSDLPPGEYIVLEDVPEGWTLDDIDCEGTEDWSTEGDAVVVNLASGDSVTCTFTNNIIRADLTIVKQADVDTGEEFDFVRDFGADFSLGDGDSQSFNGLEPGSYSVDEIVPEGWTLDRIECDSEAVVFEDDGVTVDLAPGDDVTCTFFNEIIRADLIIEKVTDVETDQRFDFDPDFADPFDLGDGENEAFADLVPGDYTVIEDVPDDWTLEDIDCGDAEVTFVDDGVTVHLESGDSVTCTFTNNIIRADLTIEKETDPEGADQEFPFNPNFAGDFSLGDGGSQSFTGLEPGSYSVDELVPDGWTLDDVECTDGSERVGDGVTVELGPGDSVTCTFFNELNTADVEVRKLIDDAAAEGWTFNASVTGGPATIEPPSGVTGENGSVDFDVEGVSNDGSEVTITEVLQDGYRLLDVRCFLNGDEEVDIAELDGLAASFEVNPGDSVLCIFTNQPLADLTIVKETVPEGSEQQFDFDGGGLGPFSLGDGGSEQFSDLVPDEYTVDEIVPEGWELTDIDCEGTEQWNRVEDGVVVNLVPGDDVTCTFTNTELSDLTIVKVTDPEGSEQQFDFVPDFENQFVLGDGEDKTFPDLLPDEYNVDELVPEGWALTDIECDSDDVVITDEGVTVDLAAGESVTCTFTNTELSDLIIEKETDVETDQRFDFDPDFADPFDLGDGENEAFADLLPGDYTVIEDVPDDWTLEDIDCGDAEVTFVDDGVTVHLESGDSVTCTFFNEIVKGDLTIVKTTDVPTDVEFPFESSFGPFGLGDGDSVTFDDLEPGEYTVEEIVPAGWTLFEITCTGTDEWDRGIDDVIVELAPGDDVTCTFANVDLGGEIVIPDPPDGDGTGTPTEVLGTVLSAARGTPTQVLGATLPFTGSPLAMLLKIALWLLVLGGLILAVSHWWRRRRMA